jgi:predicted AAA+ superfamily ATPase
MKNIHRYMVDPAGSYFLFGPRGTGKSTWLSRNVKDALVIDLLEPELCRRFMARPERLNDLLDGNPEAATVIVDEVQKVPELLSVVHQHIEQKNRRFILTGSSARKLKRSGMDLLGGRAVRMMAHPFMASELGRLFSLDQALRLGMVPLVLGAPDPERTLAAYVSLYLREEVAAEGLVRNIGDFTRFLEAISFSHGALLSISEVSRECEVSRKTVEGYVSILEDLLLGYRVPVFSKRAKRGLIKQSKFYYFDAGVFRSVRPKGPLDRPEEIDGVALEGLVGQHLRAWADYTAGSNDLFFWRTPAGVEVDFVVYGETDFCAFEVKNSGKVNRKDLRGLKAFMSDYPECKGALLYRGKEKMLIDGITCLPCGEFLQQLVPNRTILGA